MTTTIITCGVFFAIFGLALLAWNAIDAGQEKKTISEAHFMVKGFAIGFLLCFAAAIGAQIIAMKM